MGRASASAARAPSDGHRDPLAQARRRRRRAPARPAAPGTVPRRLHVLAGSGGSGTSRIGHANSNYLKENPEAMTMPRWFRDHGYQTAKIGKIAHTPDYEGRKDWDLILETVPPGVWGVVRPDLTAGRAVIRADADATDDQLRTQGCED